jgi:hypothetical protein
MPPTPLEAPPAAPIPHSRPILKVLVAIIAVAVVFVVAVWALVAFGLVEVGQMMRAGRIQIGVDQPTVVREVQALQRLETARYTMDKIMTGERENPVLPRFLAGDRLLLIVHGEVIAGVDLAQLQAKDVAVTGRSVSIQLPHAVVFVTRLDNARTRVYSRDTGIFSTPDPNLEGDVREEAERQLQQAALQDGILKTADENARETLRHLLTGLGFEKVDLR